MEDSKFNQLTYDIMVMNLYSILSGGKDKNGLVTIHDLFPTSASKSEAYADAYERGVRNAPSYPIIAKVDTK